MLSSIKGMYIHMQAAVRNNAMSKKTLGLILLLFAIQLYVMMDLMSNVKDDDVHLAYSLNDLRFVPEQNESTIDFEMIKLYNYRKHRTKTDVLDHWMEIAKKANITYYMIYGTLLGSYRHHMMIPWDHDFDVCVARSDRNKTVAAYEQYMNKTKFWYRTNEAWLKHYTSDKHTDERIIIYSNFKWPILDIFWMDENATDIWSPHLPYNIYHKKKNIFPLTERPFHGKMLPAPRDVRAVLNECFGHTKEGLSAVLDKCGGNGNIVNCSAMLDYTPFVQHIRGPGGAFCKEELVVNGTVVDTFTRTAENIPVC